MRRAIPPAVLLAHFITFMKMRLHGSGVLAESHEMALPRWYNMIGELDGSGACGGRGGANGGTGGCGGAGGDAGIAGENELVKTRESSTAVPIIAFVMLGLLRHEFFKLESRVFLAASSAPGSSSVVCTGFHA